MSRRRPTVTGTVLDGEGYPVVVFKGNPQAVADACAVCVLDLQHPLGFDRLAEGLPDRRDKEEP